MTDPMVYYALATETGLSRESVWAYMRDCQFKAGFSVRRMNAPWMARCRLHQARRLRQRVAADGGKAGHTWREILIPVAKKVKELVDARQSRGRSEAQVQR